MSGKEEHEPSHVPEEGNNQNDNEEEEQQHEQQQHDDNEQPQVVPLPKHFFYEPLYYRGKGGQIYFHDAIFEHSLPCGPSGLHFCPGGIRRYIELNFVVIVPLALIFELTILNGYKGGELNGEYIFSQVISAMLILSLMILHLLASGTDPGIIPPLSVVEPIPESRIIISEDGLEVIQDPCKSCRMLRPARSGHCRWCDCCVEMFDHHCGILQVCVGKSNIRYFILWCWTCWVTLGLCFSRTVAVLVMDIDWQHDPKTDSGRWRIVACCVFAVFSFIFFVVINFPSIHYCRLSGILALEKDIINAHRVFIDWENRVWRIENVFERLCGTDGDESDPYVIAPSRLADFVRSDTEREHDGFDDQIQPEELPEHLQEDLREIMEAEKRKNENGGRRDSNRV
jgi:hypothetical protein